MRHTLELIFSAIIGAFIGIAILGSYQSHNYHMTTESHEPVIEYVYVESEPKVIKDVEIVTEYVYVEEDFFRNFTAQEEWYVKDLMMREAEGEGVEGMLWVAYCMECRCEAFGNSIEQEWGSSAYTSMSRSGKTPNEDCLKAFELFREGWTPKPLYFRVGNYHSFGTPLCRVGNHWFSSK